MPLSRAIPGRPILDAISRFILTTAVISFSVSSRIWSIRWSRSSARRANRACLIRMKLAIKMALKRYPCPEQGKGEWVEMRYACHAKAIDDDPTEKKAEMHQDETQTADKILQCASPRRLRRGSARDELLLMPQDGVDMILNLVRGLHSLGDLIPDWMREEARRIGALQHSSAECCLRDTSRSGRSRNVFRCWLSGNGKQDRLRRWPSQAGRKSALHLSRMPNF